LHPNYTREREPGGFVHERQRTSGRCFGSPRISLQRARRTCPPPGFFLSARPPNLFFRSPSLTSPRQPDNTKGAHPRNGGQNDPSIFRRPSQSSPRRRSHLPDPQSPWPIIPFEPVAPSVKGEARFQRSLTTQPNHALGGYAPSWERKANPTLLSPRCPPMPPARNPRSHYDKTAIFNATFAKVTYVLPPPLENAFCW